MATVAVVGGGITGLSAMHYLQQLKKQQNLDLELVLIERDTELGGKIRTVKNAEFIMETGADSIVARHASVMPLIEELDLQERVVYNGTGISYLYANNQLHAIPADTVFGIPMDEKALFSSTLVSEEGKRAALRDFQTKNETFTRDSSIGEFLEAFLGKELVDNQIAPVLSGVYSGNLHELTLASTLPYLVDYKNKYGSIIKGLEANKQHFQGAANKKFISFDGGMAVLIDRLEEKLDEATIIKGMATEAVVKTDGGYAVEMADESSVLADYVILATPHEAAENLLKEKALEPEFSQLLNSSLISVYFGFDLPDAQLPADGTGFIVSQDTDLMCNACTWTSRKWSHTSRNGNLLVRLFYKSSNPSYSQLKDLSESELAEAALSDIQKSLGIDAKPVSVEVTGWKNLMPNYTMQHKAAVSGLEEKMAELVPNVKLAGASFYGVGIGACIQNGKDLAMEIAASIKGE
ncbi:protoporphyrinogen oxidase [Planococcus liqunii]|uniref:Coproporphyrinogen III oxidase n=1 Tax=Planococcus liqunii TaxID=3058394 RepID=A0ABT8MVB9_9BACL|nr:MULTISPECIES: protoporphyrinogen oxidase [unclassified Planococcus (in: firmicutes)]MDN7228870.1 protoporphyrinogen oxidase [Planococcus sp. N064]WKA51300.1 protoporphyrinogen oxidase [Planococcus sp. N056]